MSNFFLDFRLVYLRFISKMWSDDEYLKEFEGSYPVINDESKKKEPNLFKLNEALSKPPFNYKIEYNVDFQLEIPEESNFDEKNCSWPRTNGEEIILKIPLWDEVKDWSTMYKQYGVQAIADYYAHFATIIGDPNKLSHLESRLSVLESRLSVLESELLKPGSSVKELSQGMGSAKLMKTGTYIQSTPLWSSFNPSLGIEYGNNTFLSLGAAMQRVVALIWHKRYKKKDENNTDVYNTLFQDMETGNNIMLFDKNDKSKLISTLTTFQNPWYFKLIFKPVYIKISEDGTTEGPGKETISNKQLQKENTIRAIPPQEGNNNQTFEWVKESLPRTTIKLIFPSKPPNMGLPLALCNYNGTGPQYPFTCCN